MEITKWNMERIEEFKNDSLLEQSDSSCFPSLLCETSTIASPVSQTNKIHAGHLDHMTYSQVIRAGVNRKWPTPDQKEWWYTKFTMSRRKKLIKLFNQQDGRCVFCNCQTWLPVEGVKKQRPPEGMLVKQMATVDHKIPQMYGGTDKLSNLALACTLCNSDRQTEPFEDFLKARQNPELWTKRNRKLSGAKQIRDAERNKKSEERRQQRIWQLAMVFLFRPDLAEEFKARMLTIKSNRLTSPE
jgi:hypothetical protein